MKAKAAISIAIVSALGGAAVALLWNTSRSSTTPSKKSKEIREEFVPSQELGLSDSRGAPLGGITVSDDLITLSLYVGAEQFINVNMYPSGRSAILIYGKGSNVMFSVEDDGYLVADNSRPGTKTALGTWSKLNVRSKKLDFGDDSVLPTEDLILRNHAGWRFAAAGLSQSGDPGIAFADQDGAVRDVWIQRNLLGNEWWDFAVLDKNGNLRVSLEMRPNEPLSLTTYPEEGGEFYVDFKAGELKKKQSDSDGRMTWSAPVKVNPHRPITLSNNRDQKLWSAP